MRALICILAFLFIPGTLSAQHEYPATDVENGGRLFLATCATCHGPDGDGVAGVDLGRGQFRRAVGASDEELVRIIRTGIPNTGMPPNNMSEINAGNIVAYLRSIAAEKRTTSVRGRPRSGSSDFRRQRQLRELPSRQRQWFEDRPRSHRGGRTAAGRRAREIDRRTWRGGLAEPPVLPRRDARRRRDQRTASQSRRVHRAAPRFERATALLSEIDLAGVRLRRQLSDAFVSRQTECRGTGGSGQLPGFSERSGQPMTAYRLLLAVIVAAVVTAAASLQAQVTFDRILRANQEPQNWLTYSGTVLGQRYSQLTQITPDNVRNLELQWVFQARSLEKYEATSIVVDGVLYTVQAPNDVVALDAVTGRVFWTYSHAPSAQARPCCGRVNRGRGDSRRHAVHGHDRRPVDCDRCENGQAALERDGRGREARGGLRIHAGAAGRERQSHHRHRRRRVRHSRFHCGLRCPRPARKPGASTPSPARANRATGHGRATPGKPAAHRCG